MQDIREYSQSNEFLKLAPYFEVERFLDALKERLLSRISPGGSLSDYAAELKDDIKGYCEGRLRCVPRYRGLIREIRDVLLETFPEGRGDAQRNWAIDSIYKLVATPQLWQLDTRGYNEEISP